MNILLARAHCPPSACFVLFCFFFVFGNRNIPSLSFGMGLFLQDICFLKELRDLELHFHGAPWSKVVDDMKRVLFSLEDDSTGPNVHDGGFIIVNTWDFFVLAHPFICFFFF